MKYLKNYLVVLASVKGCSHGINATASFLSQQMGSLGNQCKCLHDAIVARH